MSDIITVTITRLGQIVTRAGFGTLMILGDHKRFNQRIKFYANLTAVAEDFQTTDNEYIAATAAFGQNPSVPQIAIGRRQIDDAVVSVITATDTHVYNVFINGNTYTYTAGGGDTIITIAAALVEAITDGSENVTVTDNLDGTFNLASNPALSPYTLNVGTLITATLGEPSETEAEALAAIYLVSTDWWGLAITSRIVDDVLSASSWAETNTIYFMSASDDIDILDPNSTSDIAYTVNQLQRQRTAIVYRGDADTNYFECGWFGTVLTTDVGQTTFAFKTVIGFVADDLTPANKAGAWGKNANVYVTEYGNDITLQGTSAATMPMTYGDDIRCIDWLQLMLESDLAALIIGVNQNNKVPYTDAGISAIEAVIKARLKNAVDINVLAPVPAPVVNVPALADIPIDDRNIRAVTGITFAATLAGAVHSASVQGFVI